MVWAVDSALLSLFVEVLVEEDETMDRCAAEFLSLSSHHTWKTRNAYQRLLNESSSSEKSSCILVSLTPISLRMALKKDCGKVSV